MRIIRVMLVYVLIFSFLFVISKLGMINSVEPVFQAEELRQEIEMRKSDFEEEAENAYIDRVWKKTPGRNGRKVDVAASYERMKKANRFDPNLLVYEEVEPEIQLKDLPASPIYRGHPEKKMVALLINVSWGTEYIPKILEVLKTHDLAANFFLEGKWANAHKQMVKMIDEQGHVIGNHAYNHPDMAKMSKQAIHKQIQDTNEIIEAIIRKRPVWFAPPSGSFNQTVLETASELEMETILWTVDTIDWKNPTVSVMINRVMKNIHPGALILMHPSEPVAEGLDTLIQAIKAEAYAIDTIEVLLSSER